MSGGDPGSDRTRRIREQQAGLMAMTEEQRREAAAAGLVDLLTAHDGHEHRQVARCVYCVPCGMRLWQAPS